MSPLIALETPPAVRGLAPIEGRVADFSDSPPVSGSIPQPPIKDRIARCSLEIAGKMLIHAKGCDYEHTSGPNNISSIRDPSDKDHYKVTWIISENGSANGFLQGGKSSATRYLGMLRRDGACWVGGDGIVKICATK
jgi:hypothetical protein